MKEKGIDELFSAMRRLHSELGNRVALDIVGFFDDEYYKEQVDQLVADGIAVFHGFQTEPRPYYEAADCVVLASYHEGMSNVLLEAAATGRPVITSNIHGCKEAVDADVTGLLCNVKDADSLYEQMLRMAQMPKAQRQSMGNAGRAKMEREFEKSVVVQKTVDAIFKPARV
jgi:glycosyltransferase involved in cell wall biosynthesis